MARDQEWCSGESACLPPMCSGFDSRIPGFSIRIRVGGKASKVGSEGTIRAEGTILGYGCMGACPTWNAFLH